MDPAAFQFLTGRPWGQADQERNALAGYVDRLAADNRRREEERNARIREALGQTWPAQMVKSAVSAMALPGDVYAGRVDPNSDEAIGRAADLAGLLTFGAGAAPAARNELRMGIKAYHGSPHDFDRFDMSKIGTGEGAQAYGHGLYFAGNEAVAKGYRDALSPATIDGVAVAGMTKPLTQSGDDILRSVISMERNPQDVRWRLDRMNRLDLMERFDEMVAAGRVGKAGRMYEVELNTTSDKLLDWDKPLSRQPQAVRDAVSGVTNMRGESGGFIWDSLVKQKNSEGAFGEHIADPAPAIKTGPRAAMEALRQAGIDGIQYLDAGSRGAGEGSRNYVMFDDRLVKILRKYGVAGVSALPAAALAELGITREEAERMY